MEDRDSIVVKKEVVKIESDRNLYNYTFELIDDEEPAEEEKPLERG